MRLHRFYTGPELELKHNFWLHDERLVNQWFRVLRFRAGQELVLFDGLGHDKLYKIEEIKEREAHLIYVTDFEPKTPKREVYLLFALLKKDKNDWVLQKCTELGVSHFVPLLADRSEKTGFNVERAEKIVIEAAEQCGRSDIPNVLEPMTTQHAIEKFNHQVPLLVCDQTGGESSWADLENIGILIGPEGGWSEKEMELFGDHHLAPLVIHDFTLRAETAAVTAVSKLVI